MCWDTYTVGLLGFPDQPASSRDQVLSTLDTSARRLLSAFPFLVGQVVKRGKSSTNSGTYHIVPYPPHETQSPVRRKDCTNLCPTYEQIRNADAPFSMLDGDVLCPMKGIGHAYDETTELPVFIVQANFIQGGMLLCFASMHNALDMNGQGLVMRLFAAAGRGEDFDPEITKGADCDADSVVPLLKPGEQQLTHETMRRPSTLTNPSTPPPAPPRPLLWAYWRIPADKLAELKKSASSGKTWVSTNDAISGLFTQRLTAARIAAGRVSPDEDIHLQRAVDARSILTPPPPKGYMGHLVTVAETAWPTARELCDSSLADISVKVRESLREVDDHAVRSLATLINNTEDKSTIFYGVNNKPGRDFLLSSWAQLHWLHDCDFGPGVGKPDFVRRARLTEIPDVAYIMPKDRRGNMHLAACMFHEDYASLANDRVWRDYAELVG